MSKNAGVFIEHILECIKIIEDYLSGVSKEEFLKNKQLQDAVMRRIEIIGEATKNIPATLKAKYNDIPWKRIAGMRDVLIHEYFGVDLELTWNAAKLELENLKKQMLKIKGDRAIGRAIGDASLGHNPLFYK